MHFLCSKLVFLVRFYTFLISFPDLSRATYSKLLTIRLIVWASPLSESIDSENISHYIHPYLPKQMFFMFLGFILAHLFNFKFCCILFFFINRNKRYIIPVVIWVGLLRLVFKRRRSRFICGNDCIIKPLLFFRIIMLMTQILVRELRISFQILVSNRIGIRKIEIFGIFKIGSANGNLKRIERIGLNRSKVRWFVPYDFCFFYGYFFFIYLMFFENFDL